MRKLVIILSCFLMSCSSSHQRSTVSPFSSLISKGQCKKAAEVIPIEKENLSFFNKVKVVSGTVASYTISLGGMILVLPMAFLDLRFLLVTGKAGKKIFKQTEGLRCPNLDSLANRSIEVSKCFEKRNTFNDLYSSKVFMQQMLTTELFYKCLSPNAKQAFNLQTEGLREPLRIAANKNIHHAAKNGKIKEVRLYILEGANPNTKDKKGNTPLHLSVRNGLQGTSQILYNSNADQFALNDNGDTPYDFAKDHEKKGNRFFINLFATKRVD